MQNLPNVSECGLVCTVLVYLLYFCVRPVFLYISHCAVEKFSR